MAMIEQQWLTGTPATKEAFMLRAGEMPNGSPYLIPVLVATGRHDGPTFYFNAAMHGDETLGADVLRRVWADLNVDELRGRFVATPMANSLGVATRTRRNVIEMYPGPHDMNRIFPGNARGIITERIAATLMDRFVADADFIFDVHCASVGGEWAAYTEIPPRSAGLSFELTAAARALGRSFGTSVVLEGMDTPGSLPDECLRIGKTASMVEFGIANRSLPAEREFGGTGIRNLLTQAGMLQGTVQPPGNQFIIGALSRVRTDRGGFLELLVGLGDTVEKDQPVGRVTALDGAVLQELHAPAGGLVCRVNTMPVVGTGDLVIYVGEQADTSVSPLDTSV